MDSGQELELAEYVEQEEVPEVSPDRLDLSLDRHKFTAEQHAKAAFEETERRKAELAATSRSSLKDRIEQMKALGSSADESAEQRVKREAKDRRQKKDADAKAKTEA